MRTAFIVVRHDGMEGRFMVAQWTAEEVGRAYPLGQIGEWVGFLESCGWGFREVRADACHTFALVMNVNGSPVEGSVFGIGGDPVYDLNKRAMPKHGLAAMWVAFLTWLYANLYSAGRGSGKLALDQLPALLDLSDVATTAGIKKGEPIG